ncbi:MAG: GntR family transcriptional regulator [Bacteroidota bacterium]
MHDQLVDQLRYLISSGQYRVGERLPSTRALGDQLGVSFHTVRKAYQTLEQAGLLAVQQGSGFTVLAPRPLAKDARMEQGATVMQGALRSLVGLGLTPVEIDLLYQEQAETLQDQTYELKLIATAPYLELARLCAAPLHQALQRPVDAVSLDQLDAHQDADYVFAPLADVRRAMQQVPRADVLGLQVQLVSPGLERIARMLDHETLGMFTHDAASLAPLTQAVRSLTGFPGQVLGLSFDHRGSLETVFRQIDVALYTPSCARHVRPHLRADLAHAELSVTLSDSTRTMIRQRVPDR